MSELQMHKNAFAAKALQQTPLGELKALPKPTSWINGRQLRGPGGSNLPREV